MNEKILISDVKNLSWIRSEYYTGGSSHEFICEIDDRRFKIFHELYRHDDGYGFTIHTEPEDIWDRMDTIELEKLDAVLEKERTFGAFLQKIREAEDLDSLDPVKWEMVETERYAMTPAHWEKLGKVFDAKMEIFEKEKNNA